MENDENFQSLIFTRFVNLLNSRRSLSEFECAKSWRISGFSYGPLPSSVKCSDPSVLDFCQNFLNVDWLAVCGEKIDFNFRVNLIESCKIDLCVRNTEETRYQIYEQYVTKCQAKMAPEKVLCDWSERALGGQDSEKIL